MATDPKSTDPEKVDLQYRTAILEYQMSRTLADLQRQGVDAVAIIKVTMDNLEWAAIYVDSAGNHKYVGRTFKEE